MKKVTDVHWKFWVKFLRGTNLGVNGPKLCEFTPQAKVRQRASRPFNRGGGGGRIVGKLDANM